MHVKSLALLVGAASAAWAAVLPAREPELPTIEEYTRTKPGWASARKEVLVDLEARATTISAAELAGYAPYTRFAGAAYCGTSRIAAWNCGSHCSGVPGFRPTLVGGDGNIVQYYFVGYYAAANTVIVAHQGTDPTQFVSVLTDLNILLDPLDRGLFPGVPSNVRVHSGFMNTHALTATRILAEVKRLMAAHSTTTVTVSGHSLGGALSMLDAVYFRLNLPANTKIVARTYGLPRVGNAAFATWFDGLNIDFKRINNQDDIVPIIPGRGLGFGHASGEVRILARGSAVACSGRDNASDPQCQISSVPNIFSGSVLDHLGPYEGMYLGSIFC